MVNHKNLLNTLFPQIKINGQRIEIARIELALRKYSSLNLWIVIYSEGVLAAFYENQEEFKSDFQKELANDLPFYAIPQIFIRVNKFSLNKNGKICRFRPFKARFMPSEVLNVQLYLKSI